MRQVTNGRHAPATLLARAREGDRPALGELLELYRNYLRLIAAAQAGRTLRLKMDPSDLVQEALLEAQRDFERFDGASEPELLAWLRRILIRTLVDRARMEKALKRDAGRQESLEALLERSSTALHAALTAGIPGPCEQASRREEAVLLANALSRLPDTYREVIVLRHLDHKKFEEIAVRMGRSCGAIRKLWARAIVRLREVMETER
jgi:RNA polymerase sigma-70 factor (ECF subfamily)